DRDTLYKLAPSVDLIPGMPVEVLVVTERRTMMEYLAKPFREALWRSFREIGRWTCRACPGQATRRLERLAASFPRRFPSSANRTPWATLSSWRWRPPR